jgi:hypothetical protein
MKRFVCFIALSIFVSARFAAAQLPDTLDLAGGQSSGYVFGWFGEAWPDSLSAWCGDTLSKVTNTSIDSVAVLDSLTNTFKIVPETTTTITSNVLQCTASQFETDTGGFYPGAMYVNYFYKFRNYYAQLPLVFSNWQGLDSSIVSGYKYLMVVYEGLLPTQQISLSFSYGTWGVAPNILASDSIKNALGYGDGLGTLQPSPNAWKTAIITIPDSVSLPGITNIIFGIGNLTGQGGKTSAVGNLKVARVSLLGPQVLPAKNHAKGQKAINSRTIFTPVGASVAITAFSLKGEALISRNVSVSAGKQYSISQFIRGALGPVASQVRMVTIKGDGVNVTTRIW